MAEDHFDLLANAMNARLAGATQFTRKAVGIVRAALGNEAGGVGAAALAFRAH